MVRSSGFLLLLAVSLQGQMITVETRDVVVDVTVTDRSGRRVDDLRKENFTLTDNGKPRSFDFSVTTHYEPISGLPAAPHPAAGEPEVKTGHSTAIILDEVNGYSDELVFGRQEILRLLDKAPQDERIAIYAIVRHQGLVLLQDYTTDRGSLRQVFAKHPITGARPASPNHFHEDQPVPPDIAKPVNGEEAALMWRNNSEAARASLQALADRLTLLPGRKTLFWLTAGFNPWILKLGTPPAPGSPIDGLSMLKPAWEKTLLALNQANVAVNIVDERGVYAASNPVTGTIGVMEEIAERTGGKAYYGRNDVGDAVVEGIAASQAGYALAFHLSDEERDHRFHALKVAVNRPGLELHYRQGYDSGGAQKPVDLVAGKVEGQALEARASAAKAAPLDAVVQLPWFYTGTNRASVHLTAALKAAGPVEIVGVALRPDGSEASRFADTIPADSLSHYEHSFTLAAGAYTFRLTAGSGSSVIGMKEMPLTIEALGSAGFGMSGIAMSTELRPVSGGPPRMGALMVAGKEFVPAPDNRFGKGDRVYFYTEIYDSMNAAGLTMQFRVLDAKSGEVKTDSGAGSVGNFVRAGNPIVPVATVLPIAKLLTGHYKLELRAGHQNGSETVSRAVEFDVE